MANRDLIVVGGSAGATAPLKSILERLPGDLPAAVLVIVHVPTHGRGHLASVAAAAGPLPARQAEDGMPVENGQVYIAPPDHHMLVTDRVIRLGRGPRENLARPAIDPLFRSAAACCGPRTIGVILSGYLGDGAAGLTAIKACGGVAIVQAPGDAIADEMPRRALEATPVDLCAPSGKLAEALCELVHEAPGPSLPVPAGLILEVAIAAGERIDSEIVRSIADPAPFTCPACGGVLSAVRESRPLRFRCQVGHVFAADVLAREQESKVDEALRVALRIIEERAALVSRMAEDGRLSGRRAVAELYDERAREYRGYAETLRQVALRSMERAPAGED